MDTFGIGGNISILHGVCDCHDIGRGLDAGPIWHTKIDPPLSNSRNRGICHFRTVG